jgi:hypothetical protein
MVFYNEDFISSKLLILFYEADNRYVNLCKFYSYDLFKPYS